MTRRVTVLLTMLAGIFSLLHATEVKDTLTLTKMTPLVGTGCIINQIDKNLIEAVAGTSDLGNIVDVNPNNYAGFGSALSATVAYNPTVAVKNVNHAYAADTEAGFVIQSVSNSGSNLLTADILQMFWIETYMNGIKQETSKDTEETGGTLLNLNLLTIASDGKTKVAIKATKPFNEIRMSISGVNASVLSQLKIFYAYAGSNPIRPITKTTYYPGASVHSASLNGIV